MSMTTGERNMELRARLQELDLLAERGPPVVLAERLVSVFGEHMERAGFPVETAGIRERVGMLQEYAPKGSEKLVTIEIPQGAPVEEPEASGEPEKPCKECGVTKPLSEFPRTGTYKDGHTNVCKPCTREHRSPGKRTEESKARREAARESSPPARSNVTAIGSKGAEASLCANGERCAAIDPDDLVPQPAILDEANPGPLCRR